MLCFVICPIGSEGSEERCHSDNLFHDIIEPSLSKLGFAEKDGIIRADKVENPGSINDQIIDFILNSDLIIADLSFHNPNAFYELGIADHASKPVILFSRKGERIPFDKSNDRVISADLGNYHERKNAREAVKRFAESALNPAHVVSNPVTQARAYHKVQASADPKDKMIADLQRRVFTLEASSLDQSKNRSNPIENRDWNFSKHFPTVGSDLLNKERETTFDPESSILDKASFLRDINESISASYAKALSNEEIQEHVLATLKLTAKDRVIQRLYEIAERQPLLAKENGEYIHKLLNTIKTN